MLGHLLTVLILHMSQNDAVLIGSLIEEQCADSQQSIEPATGLVNGLGDKVCGEVFIEDILIFKRIVPLCEGHGAAVEPAVNNLRHSCHQLAAFRAGDVYCVNEGLVQLDVVGAVGRHFLQLCNTADGVSVSTFTFPDGQWSTPVSFTGQTPVDNVFQEVAETTLLDVVGIPVDGSVVAHQIISQCSHFDEPCASCIIQQRCVTSPAEGIVMLEGQCCK